MKNKKWLLLLIIAFPSLFWLLLETSNVNSHRLNYYGPKKLNGKDTVFYTVPVQTSGFANIEESPEVKTREETLNVSSVHLNPSLADTANFPVFVIMFVKEAYHSESYRMGALWEYMSYKFEKVKDIPFIIVTELGNSKTRSNPSYKNMKEKNNVFPLILPDEEFKNISTAFFNEKPYYVDYSFLALIDKQRHIRGFYDARYAPEIKRLIDEYRHLRLKEEKQKIIQENEIKTKP